MKMRLYADRQLQQISFPLGGIGSGSVGLAGNGSLIDWEIYNRPNKQSRNGMTHFAIRAERNGEVIAAKVLHGDSHADLTGAPDNFGFGPARQTMSGCPHFRRTEFRAAYPHAELSFEDQSFPGRVKLHAFNPLIPLNDLDSSLPAAFFTWDVVNNTKEELSYTIAFNVANPWSEKSENSFEKRHDLSLLQCRNTAVTRDHIDYGDLTIATDAADTSYQEYWFQGSWFDALGVYWRDFNAAGKFTNRTAVGKDAPNYYHGLLAAHFSLAPGERKALRFILTWNIPNCHNYWSKLDQPDSLPPGVINQWKNYYATIFNDSAATAVYALQHWDRLEKETRLFADTLYDSTLPDAVLEAAGANISILKSPTCLRLEDGTFYGFEGCCAKDGCCEGSCTHVWNYAYALPYLFPALERSMRELDYRYNLKPEGRMPFRVLLPLGREGSGRACADGQFGNIVKVYREWKLSGDSAWLKHWWPQVKQSLEYAWHPDNSEHWDPNKTGVLHGRQHHTLDMELFGPNAWLTGFYLAALAAAAEMADFVGDDSAEEYRRIYRKGREYLNRELFNGEYFQQQINLNDRAILDPYNEDNRMTCCGGGNHDIYYYYWDEEHGQLKYQIGSGCSIDQLLAQWHANLVGLEEIFDRDKAVSALNAIHRHNYRSSFREVFNPCRLYAVNDEAGTMICAWPEGRDKPWIPIPYAEETMHGFEYAAAGQMMQYGMIVQGMQLVKAVRDRYDGEKRNPWNEIECGSNYARSMAAWAFIPILSGFSCNLNQEELGFNPLISPNAFRCFWSCGTAWGQFARQGSQCELTVSYGQLALRRLRLPFLRQIAGVTKNGETISHQFADGLIVMASTIELVAGNQLQIK